MDRRRAWICLASVVLVWGGIDMAVSGDWWGSKGIKGSGDMETGTRDFDGIERVEFGMTGQLIMIDGGMVMQ